MDIIRANYSAKHQVPMDRKILARKLGFSDGYLERIETGKQMPSTEVIVEIIKFLGITPRHTGELLREVASMGIGPTGIFWILSQDALAQ